MPRKQLGVSRHGNRLEARIRVAGHLYTARFPLDTLPATIAAWRELQKTTHGTPAPVAGSFADAVADYLAQNSAIGTIGQAAAHLKLWIAALGADRTPASITTGEINAVIDTWRRTLADGTVRKRRMWLRQFFVAHTGTGGPVQAATNPPDAKPGARAIDYLAIETAIAAMPAARSAKRGTVGDPALAPHRARVLAYTGIPPKTLQELSPASIDFAAGRLYVSGRAKGDGVEARYLELTPDAIAALRAFHAAGAYGKFSVSSLGRSVKAAFRRTGYPRPIRLYDLRHSFGTLVYQITRDQATVARLMLHADGSPITARYTQGANAHVDQAAVAAFSAVLADRRRGALKTAPPPAAVQKVSRLVSKTR